MRAERFVSGRAYDPSVLKLTLHAFEGREDRRGILLDARTLMTGYPGDMPRAYVPLTAKECAMNPDALLADAKQLHIDALFLPVPASDLLYRRAALEGVALLLYTPEGGAGMCNPCVSPVKKPDAQALCAISPAAACVQLCGMPSMPPVPDAQALDRELLMDAAGRAIDADAPDVIRRMGQLRALQIRLRVEAARQGQYTGALCAPGEWRDPAIAEALSAALNPLHLSTLPLRGAWWTQSSFSATLQAFIPEDMKNGTYAAEAALVTEAGDAIASFRRDVGAQRGTLGVIEGRLPDHACVLTLRTRLMRSGAVVEEQEIPVYVGERGPLEAAFD